MATTREQLAQLQEQVRHLQAESAEVRRVLRQRGLLPENGTRGTPRSKRGVSERERGIEILRRAGMIRELTPEEKKLAAQWDALPAIRKQQVIQTFKTTRFAPLLSESIIADRE
jgi:hypothetical protein